MNFPPKYFLLASLALAVSIIFTPTSYFAASRSSVRQFFSKQLSWKSIHTATANMSSTSKTPVYFLSHGGVSVSLCQLQNFNYLLIVC